MSELKKEFLAIGKMGAPRGLKGEVKVHLYNPQSEILNNARLVYTKAGFSFEPHNIEFFKVLGNARSLKLEGYSSPEAAKELGGVELYVDRKNIPPKVSGEFYIDELLGMEVVDEQGLEIGFVKSMEFYGASNILNISSQVNGNSKEILIPWIPEVIVSVDEKSKRIVIKRVEGLME